VRNLKRQKKTAGDSGGWVSSVRLLDVYALISPPPVRCENQK